MHPRSIAPAVHATAPLRLGLAGGGTDVVPYSDLYGGHVINATISLYTHCHLDEAGGGIDQVVFEASDFEVSLSFKINDFWQTEAAKPHRDLLLHRGVYARIMREFNGGKLRAVRVLTYSDAPPGSGVGTSSALVVCMVSAYNRWLNLGLDEYQIARLAYEIERVDCGLAGGKQDQYAASFGGFNHMQFQADNLTVINPIALPAVVIDSLQTHLLLYYTGRSRESAHIIERQIAATQSGAGKELEAMHQLRMDALEMKNLLVQGKVVDALMLIGRSWQAKRQAAEGISNSHIEKITEAAMAHGAMSLKVSGAGGGGFMMIAAAPENRLKVMRALHTFEGRFFTFNFVKQGAKAWWISR
jgi:D-glycero-alpha-D-manno-heptose-7-phosphate kinase